MTAPQCDLTQNVPVADPQTAKGFQLIPTGATLPQAIRIINNNFLRLAPIPGFPGVPGSRGPAGAQGKAGKNAKEGNWTETNRVTQKVRVYHVNEDGSVDKSQFIDFRRYQTLTMTERTTGATWVWKRGSEPDGNNIELLPGS